LYLLRSPPLFPDTKDARTMTLTKSQITSVLAGSAAALATLEARLDLLTALLPPKWAGWLRTGVIVAGVVITLFSQSLNMNHTSIPVEKARALGIDPSLHGGKK
jgi:hypothetical protein